jgi:hypothetical protein
MHKVFKLDMYNPSQRKLVYTLLSLITADTAFHFIPHAAKSSTVQGSEFGRWNFQTVA